MIKKTLFILLLCFSSNSYSQIINEKLIKKHLTTLADDLMEGRRAGSKGVEMAAKYIESEFERIGLAKLYSQNTFRQNFRAKEMSLFNIVGVLKGKSKADEYVVISAHYDHLGLKAGEEGDLVFNGANDNASGVSAVLALAEHYKSVDLNERSILFVAFTAEEMGLIGSNYFGKQVDPNSIIAGINIEMIGKESPFGPKTAWLTGFDRSNFGQIIQKNLQGSNYSIYPDPYVDYRLFFRSDNASLARLGVPAHTFSTSPMDKDLDYHKVSDETKTLDLFTISETIKAIAIGTLSIIKGNDTPSRIVMIKD
jgi:Zn-dependent M28 family amino/carboxypeptidase|tara:strand:- start:683 stop:1612 length:930 start_codon:yes stop_codon:yes gene_type:complete